jgi:hypothetical protein
MTAKPKMILSFFAPGDLDNSELCDDGDPSGAAYDVAGGIVLRRGGESL